MMSGLLLNRSFRFVLASIVTLLTGGSAFAQAAVSQKVRHECCDALAGDWRPYEDGSKDADGTVKGTCYFKSNPTAKLPELAACNAAGGPKKWRR